jgi:hypothetical protein
MKRNLNVKGLYFTGLSILLLAMNANGADESDNVYLDTPSIKSVENFNRPSDQQVINYLNTDYLATEAIVDTEQKFEAIFFDSQSQKTIGHLYWDHKSAEGKIEFGEGKTKEQTIIQISDFDAIPPTEQYEVLLRGLREAGIAWISQNKAAQSSLLINNEEQTYSATAFSNNSVIGYFDWISPTNSIGVGTSSFNVTRYAGGWAYDKNASGKNIWVQIFGMGTQKSGIGSDYRLVASVLANLPRPDVNRVMGVSGNHGWRLTIPEAWDADNVADTKNVCRTSKGKIGEYRVSCSAIFKAYGIALFTGNKYQLGSNTPGTISFSSSYKQ